MIGDYMVQAKQKLFITALLASGHLVCAAALNITLSPQERHQEMVGFGAAISWYEKSYYDGNDTQDAEINQVMFADSGLDVLRIKNWYYPGEGDDASAAAVAKAVNDARAINPNIQVLLSSWSPPASLKSNGQRENGGTLTKDVDGFMYDEFAAYWVDLLNNMGWTPDYLSFQNEPGYTATWESCMFSPTEGTYASYGKALDAIWNAISNRVDRPKILSSDAENMPAFFNLNNPLQDRDYIDVNGYHTYDVGSLSAIDSSTTISRYNQIRDTYGSRPNWMTEFSTEGWDWIAIARMIHNALVEANSSAYIYWKLGWDNASSTDSMLDLAGKGSFVIRPHYYTIKHYAKYVDKGDKRIGVTGSDANVKVSGFLRQGGASITLVAINKSTSAQSINLIHDSVPISSIEGYQSVTGNFWQAMSGLTTNNISLPANSMSTLILTLSTPYNTAPVAYDSSLSTPANTALPFALGAYDADGNSLTFTNLTSPAHGSLSGTSSNRTYTPNTDFNGYDSFTFKVNDGIEDSNTGTVLIGVGEPAPTVENRGSTALSATEALISGELSAGVVASAWFCWGDSDAGTGSTGDWDNVIAMGLVGESDVFSTNITGLATNAIYFYRCYVTNASGSSDWSDEAGSFSGKRSGGGLRIATTDGTKGISGLVKDDTGGAFGGLHLLSKTRVSEAVCAEKGMYALICQVWTPRFWMLRWSWLFPRLQRNATTTINVYGITNQALDNVLLTNSLPWAAAPANNASSGYAADLAQAVFLGSFSVTKSGYAVGNTISFKSAALLDFLKADTNGVATIILGALGDTAPNLSYAGDTHATLAPPTLDLEVLPVIANTEPTNIAAKSASLNAALDANAKNYGIYDVYVHYGTSDGVTNAGVWGKSEYVGSWTNMSANVSFVASNLQPSTNYYYTFQASNDTGTVWASPSWQFTTLDWTGETPVVSNWPTASPITYGQAVSNATLTGGSASVTGDFSYDLPGFVPNAGTYAAAVTFTPDDITNYNTVAGVVTVAVFRATPTVVTWPTASSIEEGQALSESILSGGSASVVGSFAFASPADMPSAGTNTHDVVFTATDAGNHNTVTGSVAVVVTPPPTPATVTLSDLSQPYDGSGKSVTVTTDPAGLATVVTYGGSAALPVNAGSYAVVATVVQAGYSGSTNGTFQITQADPVVSIWPTATSIVEGQSLSASTLVGGTASEPGIFTFDSPATTPPVGTYTAAVTFVVSDSTNYRNVSGGEVEVTVEMRTTYSMQISFTNLPGGATLTNFPALVKLNTTNTENYGGFIGSANGYDLRFWTNATFTGTELNYEIESFDNTGNSYIWVQVPELTQGSSIWATWGDDNYTSQQAYTTNGAVWSEGFAGVWHFNENVFDSTSNGRDGTDTATTDTAGIAGRARAFGGTNTASVVVIDDGDIDYGIGDQITVLAFARMTAPQDGINAMGYIVSKDRLTGSAPYALAVGGGDDFRGHTAGGSVTNVGDYDDGTWYGVAITKEGSNLNLYVNGELSGSSSSATGTSNNENVAIGSSEDTPSYRPFLGDIDEVRISTVARSPSWIWATHMNVGTSHSSFVAYGAVTALGGGITWSGASTSNITTTSAWATATVNTNLDTCVLVWDETADAPADGVSTNDWQYRLSLGSQSAGVVTTQMTGLVQGTSYTWRYFGDDGTTNRWSAAVAFTTPASPSVDTGSGATPGIGEAALEGRVVSSNGTDVDDVRIYFGASDPGETVNGWDTNFVITTWTEGDAFSINVTDLLYGIEYHYRVYATNDVGDTWTDVVSFSTLAPLGVGASGGDITIDGGIVTHTFTNAGEAVFTPLYGALDVEYLLVGGGGGGDGVRGGGGGGGAVVTGAFTAASSAYPIVVGAGGNPRSDGVASAAFGFTAGGGGAGGASTKPGDPGTNGSSGGGSGFDNAAEIGVGLAGGLGDPPGYGGGAGYKNG
jgi:O-glycosyl hydrolase